MSRIIPFLCLFAFACAVEEELPVEEADVEEAVEEEDEGGKIPAVPGAARLTDEGFDLGGEYLDLGEEEEPGFDHPVDGLPDFPQDA